MYRHSANLLLLVAGITWGMGFVAQQTAMQDIGPFLFVGVRFCLAALAVLPFVYYERSKIHAEETKTLTVKDLNTMLLLGLVFFLGMILQQIGLLTTTVTNAGFLTGLYVVFVPFILWIVLREKQHWIIWPVALACLLGIFLLGGGHLGGLNIGDSLVTAGAVFWAVQVIMMGKIAQRTRRPVLVATVQFACCGLLGLIGHWVCSALLGIDLEPPLALESLRAALPEILYAALIAGAFAFTLQAIGQRYTGEAEAAILLSSESVFAALFAAWFLSDRLELAGYLGCAIMFAAILVVQVVPANVKAAAVGRG